MGDKRHLEPVKPSFYEHSISDHRENNIFEIGIGAVSSETLRLRLTSYKLQISLGKINLHARINATMYLFIIL
jgi:hypothetical protein